MINDKPPLDGCFFFYPEYQTLYEQQHLQPHMAKLVQVQALVIDHYRKGYGVSCYNCDVMMRPAEQTPRLLAILPTADSTYHISPICCECAPQFEGR